MTGSSTDSLAVIDITNKASPTLVGSIVNTNLDGAHGVAIS